MGVFTFAPLRSRYGPAELLQVFQHLLNPTLIGRLLDKSGQTFYDCAFSPFITLWYLMYQRVHADHTLEAVVADAHEGGADALRGDKPPLSQRLKSWATTSYSDARQRLPRHVLGQLLVEQGQRIRQMAQEGHWRGLWLSLVDGSTLRLRPYAGVAKEFAPHTNGQIQAKEAKSYWSLMRVVVCFCARTGAAVAGAVGAMSQSEQALLVQLLQHSGLRDLIIGDSNFGIFWVAQALRQVQAHGLLRLTAVRARKLVAGPLEAGREYAVQWAPSPYDTLEAGASTAPVAGRVIVARIERKGFRSQVIYLFTTLTDAHAYPAAELVQLYGLRWHVELNLRYLKSQMELEQLEARSADMDVKEWLAGLMAYNLIRAAMLAAAALSGGDPLKLSFSKARRQLERFLERWAGHPIEQRRIWEKLLIGISRCGLPRRRKERPSEPRRKRYIRKTYPALIGSREEARQRCAESNLKS
jgi:hypothetical protein